MSGNKSAKYADDLIDQIHNILRINKYSSLRKTGLMHKLEIGDTTGDVLMRDKIKVHVRSLSLNFEFIYNDS